MSGLPRMALFLLTACGIVGGWHYYLWARLREEVAPLAGLRARHGVYFVTGNHEYYPGADEWVEHLGTLGIRVLRNERVSIGGPGGSFDLRASTTVAPGGSRSGTARTADERPSTDAKPGSSRSNGGRSRSTIRRCPRYRWGATRRRGGC